MPRLRSSSLPVPGIAKSVAQLIEGRSREFCPCGGLYVTLVAENVGFSVEAVWVALGQLQQAGFLEVDHIAEGWCRICVSEALGL